VTLDNLALVTYPVLLVVLAFFVRKWMDDIKKAIEKYSEQQRLCQLSLATTYRTRAEAERAWAQHILEEAEQDRVIDDLKTRVARIEERIPARVGQ